MKTIIKLSVILLLIGCKSEPKKNNTTTETQAKKETKVKNPVDIMPIEHATFVMTWADEVIYVDPNGGADKFKQMPKPSLVLITDIHGDHFNVETLLRLPQTYDLVTPQAVFNKMPQELQNKTKVLNNGKSFNFHGFNIKGIPMYNTTKERLKFHDKGRGNGYVVEKNDYKVYISGDTENITEMNKLEEINLAFLCMNLPYTMTEEQAVEAALSFTPNTVIPYHYRGLKDGKPHLYDVQKFKTMINSKNDDIKVNLMDWYPSM